jgi:hypothetical protein
MKRKTNILVHLLREERKRKRGKREKKEEERGRGTQEKQDLPY